MSLQPRGPPIESLPECSSRARGHPGQRCGLRGSLASEGTHFLLAGGGKEPSPNKTLALGYCPPSSRTLLAGPAPLPRLPPTHTHTMSARSPPRRPLPECHMHISQPLFEAQNVSPSQARGKKKKKLDYFLQLWENAQASVGLKSVGLFWLFLFFVFHPSSRCGSKTQSRLDCFHALVRPLPVRHPPLFLKPQTSPQGASPQDAAAPSWA